MNRALAELAKKVGDPAAAEKLRAMILYDPEAMKKIPFDDVVMVDDKLPPGAKVASRNGFLWRGMPVHPVNTGEKSIFRKTKRFIKKKRYGFLNAKKSIPLESEDVVFVYVYLDPKNPPKTVFLGFFSDKWYGAYWGEDLVDHLENRKKMGELPETGKWTRLEIPTKDVGASGALNGFSFLQFDGTVYWDTAGVGKRPGSELVDEILAAIGKNNTPVAHQALRDLLAGTLKTQRSDKKVVDLTLKAISDNIKGNKEIENLLLDAVASPDQFRVLATEGVTAKVLHQKAFEMFQPLSKTQPQLLTALAKRMDETNLSDRQHKEVLDFLGQGGGSNQLGAQLALYLSKAIPSKQQQSIAEGFSAKSSAALQKMFGLKVSITPKPSAGNKGLGPGPSTPKSDDPYRIANVLWTKDSSAKLLARFSGTTDIRSDPAAFKLAATMPLSSVRSELFKYLNSVGQTSSPGRLVQLGVFDRYMPDPALLVLMKPIWHQRAPKKKRGGGAAGEDSLPLQWTKASRTLIQSLNRRFHRASSPGDGDPPIKLHPKSQAKSHFKLSWPSEDVKKKLPGIDLAPLNVHYIHIEETMSGDLARSLAKHYLRQGKKALKHDLTGDRVGFHVDDYYKTATKKLRSVDVLISASKPTEADIATNTSKEAAKQALITKVTQLRIQIQGSFKR
ncbi:MAG: hypothetical protein IH991_18740, partial [Planctomycetes bacterium]|nr:hypothetical protein [Planctomycetota bacterium]